MKGVVVRDKKEKNVVVKVERRYQNKIIKKKVSKQKK